MIKAARDAERFTELFDRWDGGLSAPAAYASAIVATAETYEQQRATEPLSPGPPFDGR